MRFGKFLLVALLLTILGFPSVLRAQSPRALRNDTFSASGTGVILGLTNSGISQVGLSWQISGTGTVTGCSVELDQSNDGTGFTGSSVLLPSTTCTSNGQIALTAATPSFVRVNLTVFTKTGTANITVTTTGYGQQAASAGGGGAPFTPAFATTALADYRPVVQYATTSTLGTTMKDYAGSNSATYGAPATANPTVVQGSGLQFGPTTPAGVPLPSAVNAYGAAEYWVTITDPGPYNIGGPSGSSLQQCLQGSTTGSNLAWYVTGDGQNNASASFGRAQARFSVATQGVGTPTLTATAAIGTGIFIAVVPSNSADTIVLQGNAVNAVQSNTFGHSLNASPTGQIIIGENQAAGCTWSGILHLARYPTTAPTAAQLLADQAAGDAIILNAGIQPALGQSTVTNKTLTMGLDSITAGAGAFHDIRQSLNLYSTPVDIRNQGLSALYEAPSAKDVANNFSAYFHKYAGINGAVHSGCTNDIVNATSTPQQCFDSTLTWGRNARALGANLVFAVTDISGNNQNDTSWQQYNFALRNGYQNAFDDLIDFAAAPTAAGTGGTGGCQQAGDHTHPSDACIATIMAPIYSAHWNYKTASLINQSTTSPNVIKVGGAQIPQIVQAWVCQPANGTSVPCQYNVPVNPGGVLFGAAYSGGGFGVPSSFADTEGLTFGPCGGAANITFNGTSNGGFGSFCSTAATGDTSPARDTVTATMSVTGIPLIVIAECDGCSTVVDVTDVNRANLASNTTNPANLTTTVINDLMVEVGISSSSATATPQFFTGPTPGYTQNTLWTPGSNPPAIAMHGTIQSKLATLAGVQTGAQMPLSRSDGTNIEAFFAIKPGTYTSPHQLLPNECGTKDNPQQIDSAGGAIVLQLIDAVWLTPDSCYFINIGTTNVNPVTFNSINSQTLNPNGATSVVLPPGQKMRCQAYLVSSLNGGANWNCDIPQPYKIALTSQYTNSTTGFTNVSGGNNLAFPIAPNTTYVGNCQLIYQAASTGGLNIEFTGPASPTSVAYSLSEGLSATTAGNTAATAFSTSLGAAVTTATTNFPAEVSFTIANGANAGTLQLLAKSSAAAQLQIQIGSSCTIQQQ
jgi:hypothetical protein